MWFGRGAGTEMATIAKGVLPSILWSCGNMLKYRINEQYAGYHYVWCSPVFEGATVARGSMGASQAASSDPPSIYRSLHHDVSTRDRHSNEIKRQRDSLKGLALVLEASGHIGADEREEIAEIADSADIADFRPVIYAIPYEIVATRVQVVPLANRAGLEREYIVPDLKAGEFSMIEPYPCR